MSNNIRAISNQYTPMSDYEEFNDSYVPYQIDVRYYINVTGSQTNTFTIIAQRERFSENININSLNTVNKSIKNAIKQHAKDLWNYTISDSKILMIEFIKGNDVN